MHEITKEIRDPLNEKTDPDDGSLVSLIHEITRARGKESSGTRYQDGIESFCRRLSLDELVLDTLSDRATETGSSATSLMREAVTLGAGSYWLSRLKVDMNDGSKLWLIEKAVKAEGSEAIFWNRARCENLVLSGESFHSICPLFTIAAGPVRMLYFPYIEDVHRPVSESRRNFRSNLEKLVRAVAHFNASNMGALGGGFRRPWIDSFRRKVTPSVEEILQSLSIESRSAAEILRRECETIDQRWGELERDYAALPICLSHNDLGPGNAVIGPDKTYFLDFEKAGIGPVGSDMHTIIRWGGRSLEDEDEAERLLVVYTEEMQKMHGYIDLDQVRLAAWTAYFNRYSSITRWRSARSLDAFCLALLKARALLDER